ncbi:MAG: lipopolysaccharide biosynthesis protein, partial [Beijerinckiaceae bacterium]
MKVDSSAIRNYLTVSSGVFGRLLIALVYFLIVANSLSLGDFGRFAAASAVGLVLSRLLAFGFISPVYRISTLKPRLLGVYWAGLLSLGMLSLPVIFLVAFAVRQVLPGESITLPLFLAIVAAEVLGWRVVEWVVITLNGLARFGRAASLVVLVSAVRTLAAVAFFLSPWRDLDTWVLFYLASNVVSLGVALLFFLPRMRLRFRPAVYPRRLADALGAAGAEMMFYAQGELDKLLVLALAGDRTAGLYAIAMRIIDLTATPIRSFNQLLVQKLMAD